MKKTILLLLFVSGALLQLQAQDKMLTIEDCEANPLLRPRGLSQLQWVPGVNRFSWVVRVSGSQALVMYNVFSKNTDTVFYLEDLKRSLEEIGADVKGLKSFPQITWYSQNAFTTLQDNKLILTNINTRASEVKAILKADADPVEVSPNTLYTAYNYNGNLYVTTPVSTRKITFDGGNGIVYGKSAHREEFGITKGMFWSNEGKKLAFYRQDERRVKDYPIYNLEPRPASFTTIKYPCAGDSSHSVRLGIFDTESDEVIYLQTENGPYDQYLTNITWSPDDEYIYVAWVARSQDRMELRRYKAKNGELDKVVFSEENPKWVEPEHGPIFNPKDKNKFIWFSEKDGFNHLYYYSDNGKQLCQVTKGRFVITDFVGFDARGEEVYYIATKESAIERHLYSTKLSGGATVKLTKLPGTHTILPGPECQYMIDVHSSLTVPRDTRLIRADGQIVSELHSVPNPLKEYKLGETSLFPIMNGSTALYCRMILPPDFDSKQKYPVIVYVYGGPHAQLVNNTWLGGSNLWMQYMAQQGYIVFTLDNRGSSNRGFEFESAVFRNLGTTEMSDQLMGVDYLRKLPYVDTNRLGIHGWSFGAFMTTSLMTRTPDVFTVGVAGGPVIDWSNYEIMYTERYMDMPQENPEGYQKSNLLGYVQNLKGRLLLIHGTDDDVVLWQHTLRYLDAAVKKGNVNMDYFVYPGHKHNLQGPDRVHLMKKITQYFLDYL